MASVAALAQRRAQVNDRLAGLAERVNARAATPRPAPTYSKYPEIAAIERLEYLADLLETAVGPADAEHDQLVVTTEIAADLFTQVQEAQTDGVETRRPAPAHQPAAPAGPAQTATRPGAPARRAPAQGQR
jgi:hypothetical protein